MLYPALFSLSPVTAPAERVFSLLGNTASAERLSLTPEHVGDLLSIKTFSLYKSSPAGHSLSPGDIRAAIGRQIMDAAKAAQGVGGSNEVSAEA